MVEEWKGPGPRGGPLRYVLPALLAVVLLATCAASLSPVPRPGLPRARASATPASVGALFTGPLANGHSCTASVIDSPDRDLVITAAHCVRGTATGDLFVPGYRRGAAPHGVWAVRRAWVDTSWTASQDPHDDVALLQVVATGPLAGTGVEVEDLTGGERVSAVPSGDVTVTVPGYVAGVDDDPITCATPLTRFRTFPALDCRGYASGTSGSPFLVAGSSGHEQGTWQVVGVIGGFHQGGCYDWRSLSAPFGAQVRNLLAIAESGGPASDAPAAGPSGC